MPAVYVVLCRDSEKSQPPQQGLGHGAAWAHLNRFASQRHLCLFTAGINNISAIWDTEVWNNHTTIKSWQPPHLEPVKGSDGTQFRPDLTAGDSVLVWAPELFRSASMTANSTASLEGVSLLRFRPDPSQGEPNPMFYQTFQGLMNVTSPTAAGEPLHGHTSDPCSCI